MTKNELLQAYNLMMALSLEKLDITERIDVVKKMREQKKEVEDMQDFLNDLRERNQDIINGGDNAAIARLNSETSKELEKVADTQVTIKEDVLNKIFEGNPKLTAAQIMFLQDCYWE